jgi:hypothetical protein
VALTTARAAVAPHGQLSGAFGLLGLTYTAHSGGLSVARTTASPLELRLGTTLGRSPERPCGRCCGGYGPAADLLQVARPLFLPLPGGLKAARG